MDNTLLRIENLTASYEGGSVLNDVNLSVKEGEILCIVGESGSGKSTLIKAVTGFENLNIDSGSILIDSIDMTSQGPKKRKKILGETIGFIPQNPAGSFNPIRKYDAQIAETLKSHGISYEKVKVKESFTKMGLKNADEILDSRPYEISGGMNQRVAIAAAMLLDPKLLLCDEPTSALDVNTQDLVIEEFLRINKKHNTTIVMVTHNLGLAKKISDRVAIMYRGSIIECAAADEITNNPQHGYTKRLIEDVPRI